ncbi:MAG: DegQ family serine endoprotease [Acidobacteria bacterium]|nr:DegQ family serine endoprotease [Acidobacteriota bacterium]
MNSVSSFTRRAERAGLALVAAAALVAGGAWYGASVHAQAASSKTTAASTITHSIPGSRDSYADIVNVVAPAVVTIRVESKAKISPTQFSDGDELFRRFFGDPFEQGQRQQTPPQMRPVPRQRGLGSGVVIRRDGYILTNNHVIDGADSISVEFTDGRTLSATLVGSDKASDVALLKVKADALPALTLGNSDAVHVGDVVLAIGNPLGVGQTVTMGIISAKGRATGTGDGSYEDFLQTDAPINHGNSGGALVNTKGELVGINSQILSNTGENIGIGFAIPANMARHVTDQLLKDGKVHRSQLGVTIQPVTSDMAANLGLKEVGGVIIGTVDPGSAADRAGLKQGDVIEAFNGQTVKDLNALRNRVADTPPGSKTTVTIVRDGATRDVPVTLSEAVASKTSEKGESDSTTTEDRSALGISVAPLTPELADRFNLPNGAKGVVVQDVNPDGRAAGAGLQAGDVIQQVNRRPVQTVEELRTAVRSNADKPTLLLISRDGRNLFVTVRPNA